MNVVMVSPHFPPNFTLFSTRLHACGVNVLGIGDPNWELLPQGLGDALTDYYRVDDLGRLDQMMSACSYFREKYGPLDRLESHNEFWLESDARLRESFAIPGLKTADLAAMQPKSKMKEIFLREGIPVAKGRLVATLEEARTFAIETGYPVILKPDRGVGANGVQKISDDQDLKDFFSRPQTTPMFMEEFVRGALVTFDGLTDRNGRIVFASSMRYSDGMMEMSGQRLDIFLHTVRELEPDLEDAGRRIVAAFGLKERFFHVEFFRTWDDKRLLALEINIRPPGGMLLDLYDFASDVDLYAEWARITAWPDYTPPPFDRKYHGAFFGRRKSRNYAHSHEHVVAAFPGKLVHQSVIPEVFSAPMGDMCYIFRAPTLGEIEEIARYVLARA